MLEALFISSAAATFLFLSNAARLSTITAVTPVVADGSEATIVDAGKSNIGAMEDEDDVAEDDADEDDADDDDEDDDDD